MEIIYLVVGILLSMIAGTLIFVGITDRNYFLIGVATLFIILGFQLNLLGISGLTQ